MKAFYVLMIATILISSCSKDDDPKEVPLTLETEINDLILPLITEETSIGGALGIIHNGKRQMFFFGNKEKNGNQTNEQTIFEIGSIGKTMIATILAKMVVDETIRLNDPVQLSLPGEVTLPTFNETKITFENLANHTAGLPLYPENIFEDNFDATDPVANYSVEGLIDFLNGYTIPYAIGSREVYSNAGYGLLGYTLGHINNKSIKTLSSEWLLEELDMQNTYTNVPISNSDLAQPYDKDLNPIKVYSFSEATFAIAGFQSTLPDMLIYLEANLGMRETNMDEAITLTHQNTQELNAPTGVGLAWANTPLSNDDILTWHDGTSGGSAAFMGFVKDLDIGLVLLFNTQIDERTDNEGYIIDLGFDVIDILRKY